MHLFESHLISKTNKNCSLWDLVVQNSGSFSADIAIPIEVYKRVRHVHGSIIIANNTNISSPIHFPSLRSINASLLPCILVLFNENVKFSVGGQFSKALTQHPIKFAVLKNKNRVIDMVCVICVSKLALLRISEWLQLVVFGGTSSSYIPYRLESLRRNLPGGW